MEKRAELSEAPEFVAIEITEPLPDTGVVDSTYRIKGSVKIFDAIGAPPWVYAEVRMKEWYKPEVAEEVSYERGFPMPISGEFTIDFKPKKEGDYEVTVLATPAPLSLPVLGVFPVTGKSDVMKVAVGERPPTVFRFSGVTIDGHDVPLTDHDADSGLLLEKTTADYLDITPAFEWTGPSKTVTISIKAGYRDWLGAFSPKTGAYTRTFTLPESPTVPYSGELESPIRVPLTACGGLTDGAIEIVLKIAGEPDYISRIWNVYATKAPAEKLDFDLARPSVSETPVEPGTAIDITCPITSRCEMAVDARAKVIIYEGSALPGHGSKIKQYDSGVFHIEPNESRNVVIHHTTVEGTIDRRDVEVEVYIDTQLVKESEWDDVFYVGVPPEEVVDFDLTKPSVSPAEITPGTPITITCPVTSACTKEQTATAKVKIYEGSIFAGHGTLITTKTSPAFSIAPGQTYDVIVHHTAIAGTIDRRDVEVEIYVGGKLIKESEWDDVYHVTPEVELELLEVKIDSPGAGYVTVIPEPESGTQHNWYFPHGTTVYVTAHPNTGYRFKSWSGEMKDTTAITAPVYPMTEKRTITAHFEEEEEYTLSITIDPPGGGTVAKSPDKTKYTYGEFVTLTATPSSGYKFDHWSGAASGYSPSVTIAMIRDRSVVANFKKKVPGPHDIVSFTVKGDGFPFATSYWKLYHYDREGNIWQDYTLHRPGDIINVRNVQSAGKLSCHCCNMFTGEWSKQYYSREFAAIDSDDYRYDIASGMVYYR